MVATLLLPKDYIRYRLTGDLATDMSDAAGTLWLNVERRQWSENLLGACGLDEAQMPKLYEGPEVTGQLLSKLQSRWGITQEVSVVAGASDNAAGELSMGVIADGQAMLSLGTSGVYFVANSINIIIVTVVRQQ